MSQSDEPTKEELENRVDELEATVKKMMPDRRQTLKGLGLLGGGALLGGASGGAAGSTGGAGTVGSQSDRPTIYGDDANLNLVSTNQARIADDVIRTNNNNIARQNKIKERSTEAIEVHVDPVSGSDSNSGTSGSPVKTLLEAQTRIPRNIQHDVRIYLKDGDYTSQTGFRLFNYYIKPWNGHNFKIVGHTANNPAYSGDAPGNITLPDCNSGGNRGFENFGIEGVTIDGRWQVYDDYIEFDTCHFANGNASPTVGLSGYLSRVVISNCDFYGMSDMIRLRKFSKAEFISNNTAGSNGANPSNFGDFTEGSAVIFKDRDDNGIISTVGNPNISQDSWIFGHPTGLFMLNGGGYKVDSAVRHTANIGLEDTSELQWQNASQTTLWETSTDSSAFIIKDSGGSNRFVLDDTNSQLTLNYDLNLNDNEIKSPLNDESSDSMTANPESDTEDGYIVVDIGGTNYQVPIYQP